MIETFAPDRVIFKVNLYNRINNFLNYKITLNSRISIKSALIILLSCAVIFITAGIFFGSQIFGSANTSYYEERIRELKQLVREHPEDNAAAIELAMTVYLKGDKGQGISLAEDIARNLPGDSNAQFSLGLMLADNGDYREAVTRLEKVVGTDANFESARVRFYLGKSYFEIGNYQKALTNLEMAVQYDHGNPQAYYYLGKTNQELGLISKAAQAYQIAIKLAGQYPEAEAALRGLPK